MSLKQKQVFLIYLPWAPDEKKWEESRTGLGSPCSLMKKSKI